LWVVAEALKQSGGVEELKVRARIHPPPRIAYHAPTGRQIGVGDEFWREAAARYCARSAAISWSDDDVQTGMFWMPSGEDTSASDVSKLGNLGHRLRAQ